MGTYDVDFSVTLKAVLRIEIQDEEQANDVVRQLLDSYDFCESIHGDMVTDPYCGWGDVEARLGAWREDGKPTISPDELRQQYGVIMGVSGLSR